MSATDLKFMSSQLRVHFFILNPCVFIENDFVQMVCLIEFAVNIIEIVYGVCL